MKKNILAVASSGGHWQQLLLVSEAFEDMSPVFVTTKEELLRQAGKQGRVVNDCNRNQPLLLLKCFIECAKIVYTVRPKVIISTGAAPGIICMAFGKLIGAKAIWIDSFANVEQLSMSGKIARYISDTWLTQWEHLSDNQGPSYKGALL